MDDSTKSKLSGPKGRLDASPRTCWISAKPRERAAARSTASLFLSIATTCRGWPASRAHPACGGTAAAADIQHPNLARWNTRNERGHAYDNASSAAAEAVGGGQLVQRSPGYGGRGAKSRGSFAARWGGPGGHEFYSGPGCRTPVANQARKRRSG